MRTILLQLRRKISPCLLIALLYVFAVSLSHYVNGIMAGYEPSKWLVWLYVFLTYSSAARWSIVFVAVIVALALAEKVVRNFAYPIRFVTLCIVGMTALIKFDAWQYVKICGLLDFRRFGICILGVMIGIVLIRSTHLFRYRWKQNAIRKSRTRNSTFSITIPSAYELDTEWNDYINTFVERLKEADVTHEAFAVGIVGSWGTGKTNFMEKVKQRFVREEEYVTVDFYPWKCNDEYHIIDKFFETLSESFSEIYSPLDNMLERYSQMLLSADVNGNVNLFSRLYLLLSNVTSKDLKTKIGECLENTGKKVVVFIDDLDRLDGNEMLSVMKLVRNTASFKNVIYVAAYDKTFVTQTLEGNGISKASDYMRKIFPLEIPLPALPSDFIPELLFRCLSLNLPQGCSEIMNKLSIAIYITLKGEYAVTTFLKSQRDVVNFSMQYVAVASSLIEDKSKLKDINVVELFWLELIHYANGPLYEMLKNADESLLVREIHSPQKVYEYKVNTDSGVYKNLGESQQEILLLLFPGQL